MNPIDTFLDALGIADPHQVAATPMQLEFIPGSDKIKVTWEGFKIVTYAELTQASATAANAAALRKGDRT